MLLYVEQHKGGELLILDLFRKPKVTVEHSDAGIIVTMPGTGFSVIYVRAGDNKLVASGFRAPNVFLKNTRLVSLNSWRSHGWQLMRRQGNSAGSRRRISRYARSRLILLRVEGCCPACVRQTRH